MSSTNRSIRLGGPEDYFRTPSWTVRRLLEDLPLPGGIWLEPGAGDGAIIRAVNAMRSDVTWIASEVRTVEHEGLRRLTPHVVGDILSPLWSKQNPEIVVVLGNPPFEFAFEFWERCRFVAPNATIVFQLRLNFVGSQERAAAMRSCTPDIRSIPDRVSFALREADSCEYAWLSWAPGERSQGIFRVLASTSIEDRQADMPKLGQCEECRGFGFFDGSGTPVAKKAKCDKQPCVECFGRGKKAIAWAV